MSTNKIGRLSKHDKFDKERREVLNKLYNILGINDNNNMIFIYDLDNDTNKQNQIIALQDDIKEYFSCGAWTFFTKENVKRPYLCIIRSLLKDMKIKFEIINKTIERNNKKIRTNGIAIF